MSSAVCWKWIFSVKEKEERVCHNPRRCRVTRHPMLRGSPSPGLTVSSRVNDQKLLFFQRGHSMRHPGHLHRDKGTVSGHTAGVFVLESEWEAKKSHWREFPGNWGAFYLQPNGQRSQEPQLPPHPPDCL